MIQLTDVLKEMNKGDAFDLSFVTYSESRAKGGKIITIKKAIKVSDTNEDIIAIKKHSGVGQVNNVRIHLITAFNNQSVTI